MKEELYIQNENLVYFIISKYYPDYLGDEDLAQECKIGLWRAVTSYDETKSTFSTFASKCIINAILQYFRKNKNKIKTVSLDQPASNSDDVDVTLQDLVVDDSSEYRIDSVVHKHLIAEIRDRLSAADSAMLVPVFDLWLAGCTCTQIGDRMGISKQRASQLQTKIRRELHKTKNKDILLKAKEILQND